MSFPVEFTECPVCKGKETICRLACEGEPSIAKGIPVALERTFTPIADKVLGPLVKGVVCLYDVCASCGTRYCTRAEIQTVALNANLRAMLIPSPQGHG